MRTSRWVALGAAVVSVASLLPASVLQLSPVHADTPDIQNPGMPDQTALDTSDGSGLTGWPQSTEGTSGRPFVTAFSVGGTSKLTNTPVSPSTTPSWVDGWRVTVAPYNLCRTGQNPLTDGCYATPNRIAVTVAYEAPGEGLLFNFGGSKLTSLSLGVSEATEFDVTIDLQSFGTHLGWTWMNGEPTYWNVTGNVVRAKGKPRYMPSSYGMIGSCTQVPVTECSTPQASAELLTFSFVVSVDATLPSAFDGALFATAGAVIGSLETTGPLDPLAPSSNSFTYGVSAPHKFAPDYPDVPSGGADRRGTFWAVVPDAVLTSTFGIADPATAEMSTLFAITRSQDRATVAGTDVVTWTHQASGDFGTDAQLLKVDNISFSAPKFRLKRTLSLKKNKTASAGKVRDNVGVPAPSRSQRVVVSIASGSRKYCRALGSSGQIRTLRVGTCNYTVKLIKRSNGKTVLKKSGRLIVT